MHKIGKSLMAAALIVGFGLSPLAAFVAGADDAAPRAGQLQDGSGNTVDASAVSQKSGGGGFFDIVTGSGAVGFLLWMALFADFGLAVYFIVDSAVLIKPEKLMPPQLISDVQVAMQEGDVVKAINTCQTNPSPMSSIVVAAFQHVEEGFEAIQEAVNAASDLEQEKIQQHLNWIAVCGNLGPSLGLLGTVQGMILTFEALACGAAGDAAALASSIGQALWTTAAGLIVSIPSVACFYIMRNKANRIILRMTAVTMELLNGLRNVSVEEAQA